MAKAVESLLENPEMMHMKSICSILLNGMLRHWYSPIQTTLQPLLEGYQSGLENGDVESAAYNRKCHHRHMILPLKLSYIQAYLASLLCKYMCEEVTSFLQVAH